MIQKLLWLWIGGGTGAVCRYLFVLWMGQVAPSLFPWGTLGVNVLGCFLIGLLGMLIYESQMQNTWVPLLLITGFLGGFTTFSAFGWETFMLIRQGMIGLAAGYVLASVLIGLGATGLGIWVSKLGILRF